MDEHESTTSVVVGIDGSRSALDAALWAVDEAVSRDVPLRLVYAIDPDQRTGSSNEDAARDLATAEIAVRHALMAVESTDRPVKIEVEILQDRPLQALRAASRWAAMVCVGSTGLVRSSRGRIGSTASALATSAHCPVAVVFAHDPLPSKRGWVVADATESARSDGALRRAAEEARLRSAPLHVLTTSHSRLADVHEQSDRRLSVWKTLHPDLDIRAVAVHGSVLNYIAEHADSIESVVIARDQAHVIAELVGPPGCGVLRNANCSVLVCGPQSES